MRTIHMHAYTPTPTPQIQNRRARANLLGLHVGMKRGRLGVGNLLLHVSSVLLGLDLGWLI